MATNTHYKSLEHTFHNLDRLIEQAHYHANISAENWLKRFRSDVILNDPCIGFRDHSLSEQECNKQIIKNFQDCFGYTINFLHDYLNQHFQLSAQTNKQLFYELYTRKLISATQQERMLWTSENIEHLCNACDEQGKHIVSVQLIDSYRIMHEIVSELNAQ